MSELMRAPTELWLSVHLFYAEPWEEFLRKAVSPFLDDLISRGLINRFFFIRYWEKGPHIRLRMLGEESSLSKSVRPKLDSYFHEYFDHHPSQTVFASRAGTLSKVDTWYPNNSIQYIPYEPEIDRYGGPVAIRIAEGQFEQSSSTVLRLLKDSPNWDHERAMGAAMQMMVGLGFAVGMVRSEFRSFSELVYEHWMTSIRLNSQPMKSDGNESSLRMDFERSLDRQCASLTQHLTHLWENMSPGEDEDKSWLHNWVTSMREIGEQLKSCEESGDLITKSGSSYEKPLGDSSHFSRIYSILESYVHMTNNRLGLSNVEEAYLAFLVSRSLKVNKGSI